MNDIDASRKGIERWRAVLGYEDKYEVSNLGRVRSLKKLITRSDGRRRAYGGKMLKASPDAYGYPRVSLSRKHEGRGVLYRKVCHLVWEAFNGLHDQPLLRHLDDDKSNSCLYNLQPGTHRENLKDALRNMTRIDLNQQHSGGTWNA